MPMTAPLPLAPTPVPPKKPSMWLSRPLVGVYGGLAGLLVGASLFSGGQALSADPAPVPTVTVTAPAPEMTEGASLPSEEPTTEAPPAKYTPHDYEWLVGTKVTKKQCFGSAGCNVEVTIDPQYLGAGDLPDSGTIEVTYQITGGEDPVVNTFTVEGGQISYTKTEDVQTASSKAKIKAKVTGVDYTE